MLLVEVALPLSSPTYTVSHTGIRHGASRRVGECPDQAGFNTPPPKARRWGAPPTDLQQGTPKTWAQTRHNTKVEKNRGGSVIGVTKKLTTGQPASLGRKGERVSGGGKREGEPYDRGAVDLASSHTTLSWRLPHPVPSMRA